MDKSEEKWDHYWREKLGREWTKSEQKIGQKMSVKLDAMAEKEPKNEGRNKIESRWQKNETRSVGKIR